MKITDKVECIQGGAEVLKYLCREADAVLADKLFNVIANRMKEDTNTLTVDGCYSTAAAVVAMLLCSQNDREVATIKAGYLFDFIAVSINAHFDAEKSEAKH